MAEKKVNYRKVEKYGPMLREAMKKRDYQAMDKLIRRHPESTKYSTKFKHIKVGYEREYGRDYSSWVDQGSYDIMESQLAYAIKTRDLGLVKYLLQHENENIHFDIDEELYTDKETISSNEEFEEELLNLFYDSGRISSKAAAERACKVIGYAYHPKGTGLLKLLDDNKFTIDEKLGNDVLSAAFECGFAGKVLDRDDLKLTDNLYSVLSVAVINGTKEDILKFVNHPDFKFPEAGTWNSSYNKSKDHGDLLGKLINRLKDDPNSGLEEVIFDFLSRDEFDLSYTGYMYLTKSMELKDTRIFNALSKRADVVLSVIRTEDNGILKSLLSKYDVNLSLNNGEIITEALSHDITPENIRLMLDNLSLYFDDRHLEEGLSAAATKGRYAAIKLVLDKLKEPIATIGNGELLNDILCSGNEESKRTLDEEVVDMVMARDEFGLSSATDKCITSIIKNSSNHKRIFKNIIERDDVDMKTYGTKALTESINRGYEDIANQIFEDGEIVIGGDVQELINLAKEKLPKSNLSYLIFSKRELELQEEDARTSD